MKERIISLLFFVLGLTHLGLAQELNCRVTINAQQIETTERAIFEEMEIEFAKFLNEQVWTDDRFEPEEKIKCVIQITLDSRPDIGNYTGAAQIIAVRPVFNSGYETTIVNFADRDFNFDYTESQPLNFSENSFISNIASLLGYYALMVIGYDYDSFSSLGGERIFQKARQVVTSAQNSNYAGWDQFNSVRNRYWWINNINDPIFESIRVALYEYHIKGLDIMTESPEEARANILEALKKMEMANQTKPRSVMVLSFMDAKADELVNIFSEGETNIRRQAYDILRKIDPSKTEEFKKIISNN